MTYEIFIDYEDDTLEIVKKPSRAPVQILEGKYGIELHKDVYNNTVRISMPEFEILFGCSIEDIESFVANHPLL